MAFIKTDGRHRTLEGWPLVFTVLTTLSILVGTVVEFAPMFLLRGSVEPMATLRPFTPLEVVGRDLYIREGCNNCHSQQVRPFRDEVERYGVYSTAGEGAYETPHLWGSKRTGPDLTRVGGKYPNLWHVRHMENPRSTSPSSIMPDYPWLLTDALDLSDVDTRLRRLRTIGVPYTDAEIRDARALAQAQADSIAADVARAGGPERLGRREIVALVAYLQRLGVDRSRLGPTPGRAESDLEEYEHDEIRETREHAQPGEAPGTDVEPLPNPSVPAR